MNISSILYSRMCQLESQSTNTRKKEFEMQSSEMLGLQR